MPQYPALVELTELDGTNGFRISGAETDSGDPLAVASAGDVNGDGIDDLIVGSRFDVAEDGAAYVVFGDRSGFDATFAVAALDGTNGFKLSGAAIGSSVSSAGDVNNDGYDDIIVGGADVTPAGGASFAGVSYVVFGRATGFASNVNVSGLNGANGFRINGPESFDRTGYAVSEAGDVNGDGFGDLIIGASGEGPGNNYAGASYVVFGKASGFTSGFALSALNGSNGFRITGEEEFDFSGQSVSGAGDINGDGFDDLVIGAFGADPNGSFSGAGYVVFGKANGFTASVALSSLNGANGFEIDGAESDDHAGDSVSSAGDFNGDGFADIIIGASRNSDSGSDAGAAYVIFGTSAGFAPTLDLADVDGSRGVQIRGVPTIDFFDPGNYTGVAVSGAGDVNGDGFDDVIVGARYGDSYVVFGRASGSAIDLASIDGSNGFALRDPTTRNSGYSVSSAGDVNGDGFDDLIVGASASGDENDIGVGYVVYGSAPGEAVTRVGTGVGQTIRGGSFDDTLTGLGGADRLFGAGGGDTLDGGSGNDTLVGGAGDDAYVVDSAADIVQEGAGGGTDLIRTSVSLTLGANVENLILTGAAGLSGTGNALANAITGNGGVNELSGSDGNDTLDGGGGGDRLVGGTGNDVFVVDDVGDRTVEAANAGVDTVRSSISATLAANIENLTLTGTAAIDGTGNTSANVLAGNAGANTLNGGFGADDMRGGTGNDRYIVSEAGDKVLEGADGGLDAVISAITFQLGGNVENLTLGGTSAIDATGNSAANVLRGNAAANVLNGGLASDTLTGLAGADIFAFTTALGAQNVDHITDFSVADDTIRLENAFFLGLAAGPLAASAFTTGTAAADAADRVIYNATSGALLFDRDGSGASFAAVRFATLSTGLALTEADFVVV